MAASEMQLHASQMRLAAARVEEERQLDQLLRITTKLVGGWVAGSAPPSYLARKDRSVLQHGKVSGYQTLPFNYSP